MRQGGASAPSANTRRRSLRRARPRQPEDGGRCRQLRAGYVYSESARLGFGRSLNGGTTMTAAVFYATREGHTRHVAEHIASELHAKGMQVDVYDVKGPAVPIDWTRYTMGYIAASVHVG